MLNILFENPLVFFLVLAALIISISIHEFAHAFVADKLGDPTARYLGRVTLNPASHIDPIGMLLLVIAGFGWGRPVPFNPINLSNPKRDGALISFAGPLSNFLLALLLTLVLKFLPLNAFFEAFLYLTIFYNLVLCVFNLIPLHPLDGFKIVYGLLPTHLSYQWLQMEQYGMLMLLILVMTRSTSVIVEPILGFLLKLLGF